MKFAIYYLYYKDQVIINLIQTFIYIANCLYFGLNNNSATFLFIYNDNICLVKINLATKKIKLLKTFLYPFFDIIKLLFFLFSLIFLKMHLVIFKFLAIFKYIPISK